MQIFKDILDMRSYTGIQYRIDDELSDNMPDGPAKEALLKMRETDKLDEIYALAHEQLGNHAEAAKLRQWLADKVTKKNNSDFNIPSDYFLDNNKQ
jgi:hypothetical protein